MCYPGSCVDAGSGLHSGSTRCRAGLLTNRHVLAPAVSNTQNFGHSTVTAQSSHYPAFLRLPLQLLLWGLSALAQAPDVPERALEQGVHVLRQLVMLPLRHNPEQVNARHAFRKKQH